MWKKHKILPVKYTSIVDDIVTEYLMAFNEVRSVVVCAKSGMAAKCEIWEQAQPNWKITINDVK